MLSLNIPPKFKITVEQFDLLAEYEQENRIELTATGELVIMPPTGGTAGRKNFTLIQQLANWTERDDTGVGFDSSTVFVLPNGARRSPDASWIELKRWNQLTPKQQNGFPPIAPDFVIELVSPSDLTNQRYEDLQNKMIEYINNGVKLGWLIEPVEKKVEIYTIENKHFDTVYGVQSLAADRLLTGFILDLSKIWQ